MCVILCVFEVLVKYIVFKGFVVLNGMFLMVNEVEGCDFGINFIFYIKEVMIWGDVVVGDRINLEIDMFVCYVVWL